MVAQFMSDDSLMKDEAGKFENMHNELPLKRKSQSKRVAGRNLRTCVSLLEVSFAWLALDRSPKLRIELAQRVGGIWWVFNREMAAWNREREESACAIESMQCMGRRVGPRIRHSPGSLAMKLYERRSVAGK